MARRFFSDRDIKTFDKFSKELVDDVVGQTCILYKLELEETKVNVYGEAEGGKQYQTGIELPCLIEAEDIAFNTDEFGPDSSQNASFRFHRNTLIEKGAAPQVGDIIKWNYAFFEINSINENKLIGGNTEQNYDLIAQTHLTRPTKVGIDQRIK